MELQYIHTNIFQYVNKAKIADDKKLSLLAKMCRLNTLFTIKNAGSGHLGSSFSAMDIAVYLYYKYFNTIKVGIKSNNRDIYFSSKGHDVPGLYSVLYSLGIIQDKKFLKLRRLHGLDGHPDISIPGIEANTGSLGMGISKAKGMLYAKKYLKRKGRVIVLTGDGEWQEGQNFEALQAAVQQKINNLVVIMDHNKIQSDRLVTKIIDLGNLERKFKTFGWYVARCSGHDFKQIAAVLKKFEMITDRPKILIADTIKGRGVSFMEHPRALKENNGFYKWHSGAPDDATYLKGLHELLNSINKDFRKYKLGELKTKEVIIDNKAAAQTEFIAEAYGNALSKAARKNKKLIVLDADLAFDCKIKDFSFKFPRQFIESGIAEQDMVSTASGLALQGLIPVVNSFASFLGSRANEQIYNAQTEGKKIIYACHYAGLIPAAAGKSHQSLRDISLFGALPNCTIMQAANCREMEMIVDYAINKSNESVMIRINITPSPAIIKLPASYKLKFGCGVALTKGREKVLMAYGPIMMHEALEAKNILEKKGVNLKVVNMPWLNRFNLAWLRKELKGCKDLYILDDHDIFGGLGDNLINFLNRYNLMKKYNVTKFAVEGFPVCGTPQEVLNFHRLDASSLARRIINK